MPYSEDKENDNGAVAFGPSTGPPISAKPAVCITDGSHPRTTDPSSSARSCGPSTISISDAPDEAREFRKVKNVKMMPAGKESGILERHDFRDGRSRYEEAGADHHDHLIDMKTGRVLEFVDPEIERLQQEIARRLGYRLIDHRLELYGIPLEDS